jgi:hypothetical protein
MRSTEDFWYFFGDFLDWISWGKEGEDFASLAEVSAEGKRKKKFPARAKKKILAKKKNFGG